MATFTCPGCGKKFDRGTDAMKHECPSPPKMVPPGNTLTKDEYIGALEAENERLRKFRDAVFEAERRPSYEQMSGRIEVLIKAERKRIAMEPSEGIYE